MMEEPQARAIREWRRQMREKKPDEFVSVGGSYDDLHAMCSTKCLNENQAILEEWKKEELGAEIYDWWLIIACIVKGERERDGGREAMLP